MNRAPTAGAMNGGTVDGGAMNGGTVNGGAMNGGTVDGGTVDGGAVNGGAMNGGTVNGGAMNRAPRPGETTTVDEQRTNDTMSRVNRQLARIEHAIEDLMDDVDLSELSTKERLDLAVKLLGQQGRMLLIRQQCEAETPQGGTSVLMAAIMRKMRGELEGPATIITESEGE